MNFLSLPECVVWKATISFNILTLILPKPKIISLCHHYRTRSAGTSAQSDQAIHSVGWPKSSTHLDFPKMIMDSAKNVRWIIPFKKFGRLMVERLIHVYILEKRVKQVPTREEDRLRYVLKMLTSRDVTWR